MISKFTRRQLIAFVVVTFVTVAYTAISYVDLPKSLGFGFYRVSLQLPAVNGLYPKAIVTYRGVEVGTVEAVRLAERGVTADLALEEGVQIPSDLTPEVLSTSAIGEPYVNLVPTREGTAPLKNGDTISADRFAAPVSTDQLLEHANALVDSIPRGSLATTVDELYNAFNGASDDAGRLLDSATALQDEANANIRPTLDLINDLSPMLRTQKRQGPNIRAISKDLASFSDQLAKSDADLRAAVRNGPGFAAEAGGLFDDLRPTLPVLLADLTATGQVLEAYLPGIEHFLVVYPAAVAAVQGAMPSSQLDDKHATINLEFRAGLPDPPACRKGFADAANQRDPQDESPAPLQTDNYCKLPKSDPKVVRGVRNMPCPNSSRRGATAAECGLEFPNAPRRSGSGSLQTASYDPSTGRLMAPNGQFFLIGNLGRGQQPSTWQELLTLPLRP